MKVKALALARHTRQSYHAMTSVSVNPFVAKRSRMKDDGFGGATSQDKTGNCQRNPRPGNNHGYVFHRKSFFVGFIDVIAVIVTGPSNPESVSGQLAALKDL